MVTLDGNGEGLRRFSKDPASLRLVSLVPAKAGGGTGRSMRIGDGGWLLDGHRTVGHERAVRPGAAVPNAQVRDTLLPEAKMEVLNDPGGETPRVIAHVDLDAFFASRSIKKSAIHRKGAAIPGGCVTLADRRA